MWVTIIPICSFSVCYNTFWLKSTLDSKMANNFPTPSVPTLVNSWWCPGCRRRAPPPTVLVNPIPTYSQKRAQLQQTCEEVNEYIAATRWQSLVRTIIKRKLWEYRAFRWRRIYLRIQFKSKWSKAALCQRFLKLGY